MKQDLLNNINSITEQPVFERQIDVNTVIVLMIVAGALVGFFYVVKKYVSPLLDNRKIRDKAKRLVFRIEVAAWTAFTLFALTQLVSDHFLIGTLILLATVGVGWHFWKDFLPGIWIRFASNFKSGDPIRFQEITGKVEELGTTAMKVRNDEEELVFIPYSKLNRGVVVRKQAKGKLITGKIVVHLGDANETEMVKVMERHLLSCPWIINAAGNSVFIQPGGLLTISFNAVDQRSLGKAERYLKERFERQLEG